MAIHLKDIIDKVDVSGLRILQLHQNVDLILDIFESFILFHATGLIVHVIDIHELDGNIAGWVVVEVVSRKRVISYRALVSVEME